MSTTLALILLGVACVVFFVGYVFGEAVGYRCGVNDEARRYENDPDINRKLFDFHILKHFMVCHFGSELGRQDDIEHLMEMARLCLDGWMKKSSCKCQKIDVVETLTKGVKVEVTPHDHD